MGKAAISLSERDGGNTRSMRTSICKSSANLCLRSFPAAIKAGMILLYGLTFVNENSVLVKAKT
jgi:hypothetical protein